MKKITGIYNKFVCFIFGHLEGVQASCPFTLYTYTYCLRCNEICCAEPTKNKDN